MRDIYVLSEAMLRQCVHLDLQAIEVVEGAFAALASGTVIMPPIMSMELHDVHGEVDVKTAYIPGLDSFAIKMSPGFFGNPKVGLPSVNGLMIVFAAKTGLVEALLLDNGYLTDVRTAAAGAVAARHLAPERVTTATVVGTGVQARLQSIAAHLVRPFKTLNVWGRDLDKADACAKDITDATGADCRAVSDLEAAVRASELLVTTTPARESLIKADWLHPGLHITAMGSDQAGKHELDPGALAKADLYVCDRVSQCAALGELHVAIDAGTMPADASPPELGDIVTGKAVGRMSDNQITVCDLTGTGAQDTAISTYAVKAATAAGLGTIIQA